MTSSWRKAWPYRRLWMPELSAVLLLLLAIAAYSHRTTWDVDMLKALVWDPTRGGWFLKYASPWTWINRMAGPIVIATAALATICLVLALCRRQFRKYRMHAMFAVLFLALVPGPIINGLLKDLWSRPRPRSILDFGGYTEYRSILEPLPGGGDMSFPSGHAAASAALLVFYFLFRRRHRRIGIAALAVTILLVMTMSVARTTTGAHFPSDTISSGCIMFLAALILYYFVLNLPAREDSGNMEKLAPGGRTFAIAGSVLAVFMIFTVVGRPLHRTLNYRIPSLTSGETPVRVTIDMARTDLNFTLRPEPDLTIIATMTGLRGYDGWAGDSFYRSISSNGVHFFLTVDQRDWYRRVNTRAAIAAPEEGLLALSLSVTDGRLRVHGRVPVALSLRATRSKVSLPASWQGVFTNVALTDSSLNWE